jgi:hypoxanthine phosphoribosyltransferase
VSSAAAAPASGLKSDSVGFAHASERQFARLLDFYAIDWEYEPTSFDIDFDADGNVVARFTPDFYLPSYDLYIEITTLNQKLVTKKNRKARRLVELHPEINIKVLYQRDYLQLLVKYGLEPPSQLADGTGPTTLDLFPEPRRGSGTASRNSAQESA